MASTTETPEVTIKDLAATLKTDARTLRAFVRGLELGCGRGTRYAWPSMSDADGEAHRARVAGRAEEDREGGARTADASCGPARERIGPAQGAQERRPVVREVPRRRPPVQEAHRTGLDRAGPPARRLLHRTHGRGGAARDAHRRSTRRPRRARATGGHDLRTGLRATGCATSSSTRPARRPPSATTRAPSRTTSCPSSAPTRRSSRSRARTSRPSATACSPRARMTRASIQKTLVLLHGMFKRAKRTAGSR